VDAAEVIDAAGYTIFDDLLHGRISIPDHEDAQHGAQ